MDCQIEYYNKNREEGRGVAENGVIELTFLDMLQQPDAVCKPRKRGISKVFRFSPAGPRYEWLQVVVSQGNGVQQWDSDFSNDRVHIVKLMYNDKFYGYLSKIGI